MQRLTFLLLYLLFLEHIWPCASAQYSLATVPTLEETLTPEGTNDAAVSTFPPSSILLQNPVAVRYALLDAVAANEVEAACHPVAVSFFGTKDPIRLEFCTPLNKIIIISYVRYRLLVLEFRGEARIFGEFLIRNGLTPFNRSCDKGTLNGVANFMADRFIEYFRKDGWNSLGDVTRKDFRLQCSDSSGYNPENRAFLPASKLRRLLRW